MNPKRKGGRPSRIEMSLNDEIIRHILDAEDGAVWRDLKRVISNRILPDSTLKTAIDRLVKAKRIVPDAVLRKGKAVTVYRLPSGPPSILVDGKPFPLFAWISDMCDRLAETRKREDDGMQDVFSRLDPTGRAPPREDLKRFTLGPEEKRLWDKTYPLPGTTADLQGAALVSAMQALGAIILGLIEMAYTTDVPAETEQFLGDATRIYLSVLIKEIAKLGDPAYGDLESAIKIAKGQAG